MHVVHMNEPQMQQLPDGTKEWYLHGKLHREDGAAYEGADGTKQWWLHDRYYENAETWAEALLKSRNEKHDKQSIDAFLKAILKKDIEEAL